jgi:uncharacterized protein (TIGR02117 family)
MPTVRSNLFLQVGVGIQVISLWLLLGFSVVSAQWSCVAGRSTCASVFIVHDSWHAAIVLGKNDIIADALPELADFPDAQFIEFSWGDKDYFPDPDSGMWAALRAAFWSGGSVLHLVGFNDGPAQFYPGAKITELRLDSNGYQRMIGFISQTFAREASSRRAQASPGLFAYSRFYPATGKFSFLRTCNKWVAEALASAGIPITPEMVFTAGNLASQIAEYGKQP